MSRKSWFGIVLGLALSTTAACGGASAQGRGDLAAAKAAAPAGSRVFARECAACHGNDGQGHGSSPKLIGAGALPPQGSAGALGTAADLFAYVKGNMPLPHARVGSLTDADYWAVVTYLVAANHHDVPSGGITDANAASVTINR